MDMDKFAVVIKIGFISEILDSIEEKYRNKLSPEARLALLKSSREALFTVSCILKDMKIDHDQEKVPR